VFDGIRAGVAGKRAEFYREITLPFSGYNRPNAKVSEGFRQPLVDSGHDGLDQSPL
jgi:non-heme chloroperoxidase